MAASMVLADAGVFSTSDQLLATVPVGRVWIVKDIVMWSTFNPSQSVGVWGESIPPGVFVPFIPVQTLARNTVLSWQGWRVLPAGSELHAAAQSGLCWVHVSGAQLFAT